MAIGATGFYELADVAARTIQVFHTREALVDHIKDNPLTMFMQVFHVPVRLATDGTAQQGVLNVAVRSGNPVRVPIEELLSEEETA